MGHPMVICSGIDERAERLFRIISIHNRSLNLFETDLTMVKNWWQYCDSGTKTSPQIDS